MSFVVATLPQSAGLFIEANSRHYWTPIIEHIFFGRCLQRVLVMRSVKAIATLASVAAIVSSIFAFTWVGLALLGF
jgi:hypothetical protein